ncbi:MAG: hypothetical protein HC822_24500 [Oscillochloris sp.]|nr:hypothetical protein [Oscillochloris sp.]
MDLRRFGWLIGLFVVAVVAAGLLLTVGRPYVRAIVRPEPPAPLTPIALTVPTPAATAALIRLPTVAAPEPGATVVPTDIPTDPPATSLPTTTPSAIPADRHAGPADGGGGWRPELHSTVTGSGKERPALSVHL